MNGLSSVIQNLWLHPHKPEIQKWSVLWSIVTRWFWQYLLCLMWEPFFLFLHAARQLQQLWWRGQHQMRWCCAVAGVSLTVSTAPQSRASYRHTRWSHDASVNGAIRYSFTSYSPRIHTFPLGINVCTKCIHSTWIWSTSRMWTNSAKMQWNRWIVKLPLQNPEEVFWSLWIKITEKLFCCNSGLVRCRCCEKQLWPFCWSLHHDHLETEPLSKVDTLSRVSENNYVGSGLVADWWHLRSCDHWSRGRPCRPGTGTHSCY